MSKLPTVHHSHTQEAKSFTKLAAALPPDRFLIRKEDGGDYGVDRILEVVDCGEATNIRSHLQVKSKKKNKCVDGSIKKRVPTKTIVYLLRNANSLFFVYSAAEDRFYWAWIRDIALAAAGKGIELQRTDSDRFTYRFTRHLDEESLESIHAKLLTDNSLLRRIDLDSTPLARSALLRDGSPQFLSEIELLYLQGQHEAVVGLASCLSLDSSYVRSIVAHSYYEIRNLQEAYRTISRGSTTSPVDLHGRRVLAMTLCEMGGRALSANIPETPSP